MRIEIWKNSVLVAVEEIPDLPKAPLDGLGALATLLAVESVLTVEDAANAVGLTPQDLVNEAQGWAAASDL